MTIEALFSDKSIRSKEKTETISRWIMDGSLSSGDLIAFAEKAKDPVKAPCIEALEYTTRQKPALAGEEVLGFVTGTLAAKAPRVKWESAKVIGNIAHRFPSKLDQAIAGLLDNTSHEGTVVRWSAAFALGEILKLKTKQHPKLVILLKKICETEEKDSIKKIYREAIKKV